MVIIWTQIALIFFLLMNLGVALYATRRITTMDEYVKANKELGHGALIATLVATLLDAGNIGLRIGYETGLISLRNPILLSLSALIIGTKIFPKMTQFTNEYTIAELMHIFFGSFARYFTVVVSAFFCLLALASQLVVLGNLSAIVHVSPVFMIISMGLFVTLYTLLGGVRAVAKTDILQFAVVCIGSLLFFSIIFYQFGGVQKIMNAVPENSRYDSFFSHPNIIPSIGRAIFTAFFPIVLISPPVVQRVLMTEHKNTIKRMFIAFALFYIVFRSLMIVVSLTRFSGVGMPLSVKGVPVGKVVGMICMSPFCQMLFLLIACAIIMSTMDSFINSLAIMLSNDLLQPYFKISNKRQVLQIKIISLIVGLISILLSLPFKKIYFLTLVDYGAIFLSSITVPFLLAVMGLKGNRKAFIVHVAVFWTILLVAFCGAKMKLPFFLTLANDLIQFFRIGTIFSDSYNNISIFRALWYPAIVISTIAFFITHYLEHGGFLLVKRVKNLWVPQKKYTLRSFFKWLLAPVRWANEQVTKIGDNSYLFAMLVICYYMFPYWADPAATSLNYYGLYLLRIVAVLVAFGTLAGKKMWINILKPYYYLYYQWAIFFCITFVTALTTLADLNNAMTPFSLAFGILMTAYLVDWPTFWLFQSLGFISSLLIHKIIAGTFATSIQSQHVMPMLASLGLSMSIVALFINRNRKYTLALVAANQELEEEKQNILSSITESADQLSKAIRKDSVMMKELQKNFGIMKLRLGDTEEVKATSSALQYFYKKSEDSKRHLRMNVQKVSMDELFNHAWSELTNKGLRPSDYNVRLVKQNRIATLLGDFYYLKTLLVRAAEYGLHHSTKNTLQIVVSDVLIQYDLPDIYNNDPKKALRIVITNQAKPALDEQTYSPYQNGQSPIHAIPQDLKNNLRIIKAHFGCFSFTRSGKSIMQTYVFPLNLKIIKPRIETFVYEELFDQVKIDTPEDLAFLKQVAEKGLEDSQIKLAMRVAKHYHFTQKRKSGEPYYLHPLSVASILLDYTDDPAIIVAGLLHDTLEDTPYEATQMTSMFGERVTRMVQEVTHLYNKEERPKIKLEKKETLTLLIQEGSRDSLLVKLVDRLHNMRTIQGQPTLEKRKKVAEETQRVFVPIARELGLPTIEEELQASVKDVMIHDR